MFVYQVLLLPWLFLAFKFASGQSSQNSVNVPGGTYCNPPYVLQHGLCVISNTYPCGSGERIFSKWYEYYILWFFFM